MGEVDDEIREIKKEIIESRGLVIKTNNLTNSLSADIKTIAKRQSSHERRSWWNSMLAFSLLVGLSITGVKLLLDVSLREIETKKHDLQRRVDELEADLEEEVRRAERRAVTEARAVQVYTLARQGKRAETIERYRELSPDGLSEVEKAMFVDLVGRLQGELSMEAYQKGLELERTARYADATESYEEALRMGPEAAHGPAVRLHLGATLRRLGKPEQAKLMLQETLSQNQDRDVHRDAMWELVQCNEDLGDLDASRSNLRAILRKWPRSSLAPDARKRLGELNLKALRARKGG